MSKIDNIFNYYLFNLQYIGLQHIRLVRSPFDNEIESNQIHKMVSQRRKNSGTDSKGTASRAVSRTDPARSQPYQRQGATLFVLEKASRSPAGHTQNPVRILFVANSQPNGHILRNERLFKRKECKIGQIWKGAAAEDPSSLSGTTESEGTYSAREESQSHVSGK